MPPAGFEQAIAASERRQTYALDRGPLESFSYRKINNTLILKKLTEAKFGRNKNTFRFALSNLFNTLIDWACGRVTPGLPSPVATEDINHSIASARIHSP
jgi:hypothetical protein